MHSVLTTVGDLCERIGQVSTRARLIVLDGFDGAGKSTLAKALSEALGLNHIEVDEFLVPDSPVSYVESIRCPDLAAAIGVRPCILDGVFARDVLDRLNLTADLHVYVKRMRFQNDFRRWLDGEFEEFQTFAEWKENEDRSIAEYDKLIGGTAHDPSQPGLFCDLRDYHFRRPPHERTDLIFERPETD
jgi:hypothetical protein